jgi:hypothetical protein
MQTVRRSLILLVALALLTVPMVGPASACTTEDVHVIAHLDPTSIVPGETAIDGSIVNVRGIVLEYEADDLIGTWPMDRIRLTVNYRIDLDTGRGVIWGTSESLLPDGYRGYHVGRVFDAVATNDPHVPIAFSFTNRQVTYGDGTVIVVRGSSADSGFTTELVGTMRTFG